MSQSLTAKMRKEFSNHECPVCNRVLDGPYVDCSFCKKARALLVAAKNTEILMECGHTKDCLVEREVTNIEKNEGPLNDTEHCFVCFAVAEHDNRIWAEALAAVLRLLRHYDPVVDLYNADNSLTIVEDLAEKVEQLQPAASHLEALLQEEREKALLNIIAWRRDLLEAWRTDSRAWMTALLEGGPNMDIEKARASEGECVCEFDFAEGDGEESWHYTRECDNCGNIWAGLHCIHDGYQNPCPACGIRPTPIPEGPK